jgi:NTP pyrophosphatase (non-canonical NTP hydrolase)
MDFNEFQKRTSDTSVYEEKYERGGLAYTALGLAGEAGEVANKVKKILRGDRNMEDSTVDIADELGDVLWYAAQVAENLGVSLDTIAQRNIQKLLDRKERGVVKGFGDNR